MGRKKGSARKNTGTESETMSFYSPNRLSMSDSIRCSIIGNAGGGKSILSRALASKTDIPLHEMDTYLWKENLQSVPSDTFIAQHDKLIANERWIIDGFGIPESIVPRFDRSTHIVFVDLPIWLHFAIAAERQMAWKEGTQKHPPGGMSSPPPTKHLFEMMWRIHTELRPRILDMLDAAEKRGVKVEIITSTEDLRKRQFDPLVVIDAQ